MINHYLVKAIVKAIRYTEYKKSEEKKLKRKFPEVKLSSSDSESDSESDQIHKDTLRETPESALWTNVSKPALLQTQLQQAPIKFDND